MGYAKRRQGHPGLRARRAAVPDPRYMAQMDFAKARFPDDDLVRLADLVFEVVPQVLREQGKAKNPRRTSTPSAARCSTTTASASLISTPCSSVWVGRSGVTANYVWARARLADRAAEVTHDEHARRNRQGAGVAA